MNLDEIIGGMAVEPRDYQSRIVAKVSDMFNGRNVGANGSVEPPAKSVMIESPTGSGKTVMGLFSCRLLQEEFPGLVVCWVAMRRNLLAQAAAENTNKLINVNDIHFVSMFDKSPDAVLLLKNEGRKVLLVIDEAQHDAASSMAHLYNLIRPDFTLGLTATPFRTDRMKLVFDKVIKDAGIHQLIQSGHLSKFDHFTIPEWTPESVADHYCREPERWGKSIFYFVNLDQCYALHKIFQERGVVSDVVTGSSDWESQLERFKNGETPCLINCMKLTEGFDEPSLRTAWVRDSGKGPTMQMGGRAFRKHPDIPVKNIVQSKESEWPFIRTAMPVFQYSWEGGEWRSLTINPKIEEITIASIKALAAANVELPAFIIQRQSKKRLPRLR